jgi:hypothetical protein
MTHIAANSVAAPKLSSNLMRQTPRCLRIIATSDDKWQKCQDVVVVWRWDVVKHYIGSMADLMKTMGMKLDLSVDSNEVYVQGTSRCLNDSEAAVPWNELKQWE